MTDVKLKDIEELLLEETGNSFGENKFRELARLIFEINRRDKASPETLLKHPEIEKVLRDNLLSPNKKFDRIKKYLFNLRFPGGAGMHSNLFIGGSIAGITSPPLEKNIQKKGFYPNRIFLEKNTSKNKFAEKIVAHFPKSEKITIESIKEYKRFSEFGFDTWKKDLFISDEKTDFFKSCPCTKHAVSCGYKIFNLGFGCPYDCSYCYLQEYTNFPGIILNANIEDFFKAFEWAFKGMRHLRIGTGEFTDSLALDNITGYSKELVTFFGSLGHTLELKTKSTNISNLQNLHHNGKTVIAWSLNPQKIVAAEELNTASLEERLKSMAEVKSWGYKVAAHFDPIIFYPGYLNDYKEVIEKLYLAANGDLSWISLGTLRFRPRLKGIIEERFPKTNYIYEEFIVDHDKKVRYYPELRVKIYNNMADLLRKKFKNTPIYLCMEEECVWKKISGLSKVPF